jgi:hypothetical protein
MMQRYEIILNWPRKNRKKLKKKWFGIPQYQTTQFKKVFIP